MYPGNQGTHDKQNQIRIYDLVDYFHKINNCKNRNFKKLRLDKDLKYIFAYIGLNFKVAKISGVT